MSCITTFTGQKFSPLEPDISQISITDIAHALSLLCRANGHIKQFFSVAQHSIHCAIEANARNFSPRLQLACLLHDASEAYISDITRPVKRHLDTYQKTEENLQNLIYQKYLRTPLTQQEKAQVQQIDDDMLVCELNTLMQNPVYNSDLHPKATLRFDYMDFALVEHRFIQLFNTLTQQEQSPTPTVQNKNKNYLSVGIDGCRRKWLTTAIYGEEFDVRIFDTIDQVCTFYQTADSIIIDMPIGLAENPDEHRPDVTLRSRLKGKSSSVFNTPCRQAVYETEYQASSNRNAEIMGSRLSKQSFAIIPKIREIDSFLHANPEWKNRLIESHPEYCFALLNNGEPILENKKTAEGSAKRLNALTKHYKNTTALFARFKKTYPRLASCEDDFLDALSMAVIGAIGLNTGFTSLPSTPMLDSRGIKMQIIGAKIPSTAQAII